MLTGYGPCFKGDCQFWLLSFLPMLHVCLTKPVKRRYGRDPARGVSFRVSLSICSHLYLEL